MPGVYVASSDTQTQKLWESAMVYKDVIKKTSLNKFMSKDGGSIVHEKSLANKVKGDQIYFTLRYRNTEGFLPSRTAVRGNENNINTSVDSVTLLDKNMGMITGATIDKQRVPYDMDSETKAALVDCAAEAFSQAMFTELFNDTNTTDYLYLAGGTKTHTATRATAKAAITAADLITPEYASAIKRWAMHNRTNDRVPLKPILTPEGPLFVCFIPGNIAFDLRTNTTWVAAVKDAMERGSKNPLFTGATAYWDGIVFYEDEFLNGETFTNGGAGGNVTGGEIIFCGQQALLYGRAGLPTISTESVSHNQFTSYAYLSLFGLKKPVFTSPASATAKQFGSVNVLVASSQVVNI